MEWAGCQRVGKGQPVAVLESGDFVVVWESGEEFWSTARLRGQLSGVGEVTAGLDFHVSSSASTDWSEGDPAIAATADGGFVVAWHSCPELENEDRGPDGDGCAVLARMFDSSGQPTGSEFILNDAKVGDQGAPAVAVVSDGSIVVAWESWHFTEGAGVFARRIDPTGVVSVPTDEVSFGPEYSVASYGDGWVASTRLAALTDDRVVVTWARMNAQANSAYVLRGSLWDFAANGPGTSFQINAEVGTGQGPIHSLIAPNDQEFIVAWGTHAESPITDSEVFAQRLAVPGLPQGSATKIGSCCEAGERDPALVSVSEGGFVAAWRTVPSASPGSGQDGDETGVFAGRFSPTGMPLSPEIQVNVFTDDTQSSPSVARFEDDSVILVWESCATVASVKPQDGEDCGIFAQRFDKDWNRLYR